MECGGESFREKTRLVGDLATDRAVAAQLLDDGAPAHPPQYYGCAKVRREHSPDAVIDCGPGSPVSCSATAVSPGEPAVLLGIVVTSNRDLYFLAFLPRLLSGEVHDRTIWRFV